MPPVVAGAIVALIGFNLAPVAWSNFQVQPLPGTITLVAVILFSVLFRGFLGRISIFLGVIVGYVATVLIQVATGETLIDFAAVEAAPWVGLPEFRFPDFASAGTWSVIAMFLPVVLVLVAENVGHVRGVAAMTMPRPTAPPAAPSSPTAPPRRSPERSAARARPPTARTSASWPRPACTPRRCTGSPV